MPFRKLEFMPDAGEQILMEIGRDARHNHVLSKNVDFIKDQTADATRAARGIGIAVVEVLLDEARSLDLERISRASLSYEEAIQLAKPQLGEIMIERAEQLQKLRRWEAGLWATIRVIAPGLLVLSRYSGAEPQLDEFDSQAKTDKVYQGKVKYIYNSPDVGGRLGLVEQHKIQNTHLCGLVHPLNGSPRVTLEIYKKLTLGRQLRNVHRRAPGS